MISGLRLRIAALTLALLLCAPLAGAFAITDPDGKSAARKLDHTERWSITSALDGLDYSIHGSICADLRFIDGSTCADIKAAISSTFSLWSAGHAYLHFVDTSPLHPLLTKRGETGAYEIGVSSMAAIARNGIDWSEELSLEKVGVTHTVSRRNRTGGGSAMIEAMITINDKICFYLDFAKIDWQAQKTCAAQDDEGTPIAYDFRAVMAHEIGHAIGLSHPDLEAGVNFDNDDVRDNAVVMDCTNPAAGLKPSPNVAVYSVMNRSFDYPIERGLGYDDLAGRNFLYPACETAPVVFDATPRLPYTAIMAVKDDRGFESGAMSVSSWNAVVSVRGAIDGCLARHPPERCRYAGGARDWIAAATRVDIAAMLGRTVPGLNKPAPNKPGSGKPQPGKPGSNKPPPAPASAGPPPETLILTTGATEAAALGAMAGLCKPATDTDVFCPPIGTFPPLQTPPPWLTLPEASP